MCVESTAERIRSFLQMLLTQRLQCGSASCISFGSRTPRQYVRPSVTLCLREGRGMPLPTVDTSVKKPLLQCPASFR